MSVSSSPVQDQIAEISQDPTARQLIEEYGVEEALEQVESEAVKREIEESVEEFITTAELPVPAIDSVDGDINEAISTFTCAGCGCTTTCTPL